MSITEETRREAYYEAQTKAPTRRYEIYRLLKESGPMSSEEIMEQLRIDNPNCIRPRLSELKQAGLIETCGKTLSKYGNIHIAVWQITEAQNV